MKELAFEVTDDNTLLLHIGNSVIIPFANLAEWEKFANDMLHMTTEISETME
jgi:hypothetical protein